MPLDLRENGESWPWVQVRANSFAAGPGDYKHTEVRFADIILFGQYFSRSEEQSPGLFDVVVTHDRIGFIPWDVPRRDDLLVALSQYWGVGLPWKEKWMNYNRKRGTDSRILWPKRYRGQPLFQYRDVSHATGIVEKLARIITGPEWEPSLSPLARQLLTVANEPGGRTGDG